jgi:hypothetical protein
LGVLFTDYIRPAGDSIWRKGNKLQVDQMFSLVSFHVQHCCKSSRRPAFQEASLIPDKTAVILLHCQPGGEEKENGTTRELEKVFHRLPERPSSPP